MKIEPVTQDFGAIVSDIDLAEIDASTFGLLQSAWFKYAVLVFPGQSLTTEDHFSFSRRFGYLEKGLPSSKTTMRAHIGNVGQNNQVLSKEHMGRIFNIGNSVWHTDSSYKRVAAKASLLAAHMVPDTGGETEWADMRAGYDVLPQSTKDYLEDKLAIHNYAFSHAWHYGVEMMSDEGIQALKPVRHKVVQVHPDSKRKTLFIGRHASHLVGESFWDSRKLLRELTFEAAQPPRTFGHQWQVGDLVLWDNRCVLHRARPSPADQPRKMIRSTVAGDASENEWAHRDEPSMSRSS